mmetsp:Transcript_44900/g.105353  ORF Transcript_44900/g.105353 Transcript_44900/m.105353 type:complete len:124 (-) Transcript_44900:210-581(-)|eukprot:1598395-Rhodomonas_salina.3
MQDGDVKAMVGGALGWGAAIPAVILAGRVTTPESGTTGKVATVAFGVALAVATTPLLSYLLGWKTQPERIRGVALALGTAQTIDGVVHLLRPTFYSENASEGIASAGNIFFGAGLLGIMSVYT